MKIQCQSCQAKYTIADEKVLGKVVKIRCKKCSSTIVINGNETRPAEDNADTQLFDYAGQANEQWTVNVADGDQRTMTAQEIALEYRSGVITDETYCWKDDMADWLPLREIEQLYGAVKIGRAAQPSLVDDVSSVPAPAPLFGANESTDSPFAGRANGNGNGSANGNGLFGANAEAHAAAPTGAAARRGGGRGQGADLFGNAERAGGEEDVMTSATSGSRGGGSGGGGGGAAVESAEKLTGQRNENSVLFSLSALTDNAKKEAAAPSRTTATADGSGLIDIRALSQTMGSDDKKDGNNRVDDIMNLSGGGAFGAALAAPILAPPPLEMADPAAAARENNKSNKGLLFGLLGAGAFIAIAIVAAVVLTKGSGDKAAAEGSTPNSASTATVAPTADPAAVAAAAAALVAANASAAAAAAADNTPPPPGVGQANGTAKAATGTAAGGSKTTGAVAAAAPSPKNDAPKNDAPKDFGSALAQAAGKPAEAPKSTGGGGSSQPFDRGAAAGALGGVNVQSCKKPDGPTGSGHVKVTFSPDGSVSSAVVDAAPYQGTGVGGCIAGKYRAARVPAFSGGPVSVGKSFTIN
jgi:predicted Zn finger-like uncharacterized protein